MPRNSSQNWFRFWLSGTKPSPKPGLINTLRTKKKKKNWHHFKYIFLNENVWISIKISLKFVPMGLIHNILSLVQIMAWRGPGDKPLYEPMMVSLLTNLCVTRPQWVKKICHHMASLGGNELMSSVLLLCGKTAYLIQLLNHSIFLSVCWNRYGQLLLEL